MAVKLNKGSVAYQLPVTPMVDLVFNLLLFFVVATRFAEPERQMPVLLPEAAAAEQRPLTAKTQEVVITINEKGQYYIGNTEYTRQQLFVDLDARRQASAGHISVSIRADKRCQWQDVVAAMDLCRKAKIRKYDVDVKTRDARKAAG